MSGANSTPLGKAHPSIGSKKSSSSGGSLLKPSYMTNASNGSSAMGPAAITSAAAAAAKAAAAALAINNKREREQSPDRGRYFIEITVNLSYLWDFLYFRYACIRYYASRYPSQAFQLVS